MHAADNRNEIFFPGFICLGGSVQEKERGGDIKREKWLD